MIEKFKLFCEENPLDFDKEQLKKLKEKHLKQFLTGINIWTKYPESQVYCFG